MEKRNTMPVTALLMLTKDDKVLLLKRVNTGYEDGKFCFPGGHVEKGEEIKDAAIREAKEEIGVDIKKEDLQVINVLQRKIGDNAYIDFILKCDRWENDEKIMEKDICEKIEWFDINNIPDNVIPFMKKLFKGSNNFYIPFGWEE